MQLSDRLVERLARAGVTAAYLFGSRATGTHTAASDADVAVLMAHGGRMLTLAERSGLANAFADALEAPDADLVVLNEAPLELRGRVVREGRLLYRGDEAHRVRFEVDTLSRWLDVEPTVREQDRAYLARVAREGLG
ncbi:MAG: nucleotidyltransferase domain-containing protein [Actinomycetota bacterium]|jgi:predicted nucleotidyltransferase|nr:nucleotidyltransferase domain-containing protein [Euzebyaceae bacterium]MDQ3452198.1 nucleotidyltransferase domain-containing protein [Actinomycetota bacterium]